jgi:hypothetical protein
MPSPCRTLQVTRPIEQKLRIPNLKPIAVSTCPHPIFRAELPPGPCPSFACQLDRQGSGRIDLHTPGFNRRRMDAERKAKSEAETAASYATDAQVVEGRHALNRRLEPASARRMPFLFAPTIGAALASRHHDLWVYCPACCATRDVDLRTLDRRSHAAVTSMSLSCRSCRPHAPFAESRAPVENEHRDEARIEYTRRSWASR